MQDDPTYVRRASRPARPGISLKEAADTELVQAVREVAAGRSFVHPALGRGSPASSRTSSRRAMEPLSEREREVLRLLALGHTNQEIARMLSISVRTVETHRAHLVHKLGLKTRAEIVRYALATGQLEAAPERPAT